MSLPEKNGFLRKLFLPSLMISQFSIMPAGILTGLLLIDIASTFEVSVGVMGQISTASSTVAIIFALLMGVLSIRFRHKSLLIAGLSCVSISALGCSLASNFNFVLLSYSLTGLATAIVTPMTITLIGEHLPLERRANAVGWVVAGGSLSYVIGAPVIGSIAGAGGWRSAFLVYVMPVALASLFLASATLRSPSPSHVQIRGQGSIFGGFREVLSNKSAVACLVGNVLRMASFMTILLYGTSLFRQRFLITKELASFIMLGSASWFTLGSLVGGRLVNRIGRKPLLVLSVLLAGIFTIFFTYVPDFLSSLALNYLGSSFFGVTASTSHSFTLEQVPKFRGPMMSINSAAQSAGSTLGAMLGGLTLDLFGYEVQGGVLGAVGIVSALIFFLLATDPVKD